LIVAALIVSSLHQRNPLYRLTDYFEQFDAEAIFGNTTSIEVWGEYLQLAKIGFKLAQ
jgi:hypothetical protein